MHIIQPTHVVTEVCTDPEPAPNFHRSTCWHEDKRHGLPAQEWDADDVVTLLAGLVATLFVMAVDAGLDPARLRAVVVSQQGYPVGLAFADGLIEVPRVPGGDE